MVKMNKSYKTLGIMLVVSILLHIGLLFSLHIPDMTNNPVAIPQPIEVAIQEAPAPPEETAPPAAGEPPAATAADKNHDAAVAATSRPIKKRDPVVMGQNQGKDESDSGKGNDIGPKTGDLGYLTNSGPKSLTEEEKNNLKEKQAQSTAISSEESTSGTKVAKAETEKSKKTAQITAEDIKANAGRIQPQDGVNVPFPKQAELRYKGLVPGSMTFNRSGDNYTIHATIKIPFKKMEFVSKGKIQGNKLVPESFTDTRSGILYARAEFDYENRLITYGKAGETKTSEMGDNPLDLFSAAWQLAMNKGHGSTQLQVTSGKGVKVYAIQSQTVEYQQGEGKLRMKKFNIPQDNKGFGLAVDFAYVPATITYDGYEIYIDGIKLDGVNYWQAINKAGNK